MPRLVFRSPLPRAESDGEKHCGRLVDRNRAEQAWASSPVETALKKLQEVRNIGPRSVTLLSAHVCFGSFQVATESVATTITRCFDFPGSSASDTVADVIPWQLQRCSFKLFRASNGGSGRL